MPNYCDNTLVVYAEDEIIEQIKDFICSDEEEFDFRKIIPMPDELEEKDRHDWYCENWGTKCNPSFVDVNFDLISFATAWSPCSPIIAKLASLFPEAEFYYEYEEMGENFIGMEIYSNGELTYEFSGTFEINNHWEDDDKWDIVQDDMSPMKKSGSMEHTIFKRCEDGFSYEDAYIREYENGRIIRKIDGEIRYKGELPDYLLLSHDWFQNL